MSGPDLLSPLADTVAQRPDIGASARVARVRTREEAEKVAKEFESMFISEMLSPMFSGVSAEAPFGGGSGEQAFRPFLTQHYAQSIVEGGGVGVADSVLHEILRMQGLE